MEPRSVSCVVTDPPYGLVPGLNVQRLLAHWLTRQEYAAPQGGFMGADWDQLPGPDLWRAVYRVMAPGAHMAAFAGTRTYDLMALSLRLAGFEVRDTLMWLYGSGFPKGHDVGKAIDKRLGAEREVTGVATYAQGRPGFAGDRYNDALVAAGAPTAKSRRDIPATDEARLWQGWNTALKPAWEPIILARKPLSEGTVADQVLATGTGAINIDGCRIGGDEMPRTEGAGTGVKVGASFAMSGAHYERRLAGTVTGRWPANVVMDDEAAGTMDAETRGAPSRFFYCPKASRSDRGEGNMHPTVKPQALMRWLVRLIAPPGGLLLDPFAGSGSTLLAARAEGIPSVGIEGEPEHVDIINRRLAA